MIGNASIFGLPAGLSIQHLMSASNLTRVERGVVAAMPRSYADPLSASAPNARNNDKTGQEKNARQDDSSQEQTPPSSQAPPAETEIAESTPSLARISLPLAAQRIRLGTVHLRALQQTAQTTIASGDVQRIKSLENQVKAILAKVGGVLQGVKQIIDTLAEAQRAQENQDAATDKTDPKPMQEAKEAAQDALMIGRNILRKLVQARLQEPPAKPGQERQIPEVKTVEKGVLALGRLIDGLKATGIAAHANGAIVDTRA